RLRRDSFPAFYLLEVGAGAALPLLAVVFAAFASGYSVIAAVAAFIAVWYGAEMLLAAAAGWYVPLTYPLHGMLRDAMLPVLWFEGWREQGFIWRGNAMSIDEGRI